MSGGNDSRLYSSTSSQPRKTDGHNFDVETDVLVIGAGGAGLTASLRARTLGLDSIVVEKASKIGGSTAYSGGGLWIPENHVAKPHGYIESSREDILRYMESVITQAGDAGAASTLARRNGFLDNAPRMVKFLEEQGFAWVLAEGYPDYYTDLIGSAKHGGRTIEGATFDARRLGDWESWVLARDPPLPPLYTFECSRLYRSLTSLSGLVYVASILGPRMMQKALGKRLVSMGQSLIYQLLYLNKKQGNTIWRDTPLVSLVSDANTGAVIGAKVKHEGRETVIHARRGVLLCAGGFARNKEMRELHGPHPASIEWTSVPPGDNGDAISEGVRAGAATTLLDDAWWGPTLMSFEKGQPTFAVSERSLPFTIIVDKGGNRYVNEAADYTKVGRAMYNRHQEIVAVPSWLITDKKYFDRYMLNEVLPRNKKSLRAALDSGRLITASTLADLATKIGVDGVQLQKTVTRWNDMSKKGVDEDFGRGSTSYDKFFGDPLVKPNPNMGPIDTAPFYATLIYPGDLGTKGGLVTDEYARVLRPDGSVIEGLYGAGNTTGSLMGRTYPGAGSTLGPAMTFSYVAANHMALKE
ncbi:FAD binding domain-containing protein [Xylariales sp. PMI_506]|nr:FAD binding domain-containing protein [Xylariales sp. PMI_506]